MAWLAAATCALLLVTQLAWPVAQVLHLHLNHRGSTRHVDTSAGHHPALADGADPATHTHGPGDEPADPTACHVCHLFASHHLSLPAMPSAAVLPLAAVRLPMLAPQRPMLVGHRGPSAPRAPPVTA